MNKNILNKIKNAVNINPDLFYNPAPVDRKIWKEYNEIRSCPLMLSRDYNYDIHIKIDALSRQLAITTPLSYSDIYGIISSSINKLYASGNYNPEDILNMDLKEIARAEVAASIKGSI